MEFGTPIRFAALALCAATSTLLRADDRGVEFQRHIQPIFAEHCARCHGVDEGSREAGLRLDQRAAAMAGGDSGVPAIVPGDCEESELIARISSDDPDYVMPPPSENKPLSKSQKDLLRSWIADGAPYSQHWAFVVPQQVALEDASSTNPIDQIVARRLADRNLRIAPAAPANVLCRRLYLDLIGLPPSPSDLDAFESRDWDKSVDHLLASDRYGEKWARHWLDVARYSDTNGYEKDRRRDQWAWRDWVIEAFNADMPYDKFIIEQIAGDMLPNATQSQVIATGFLRNSMLNEEGAIIPEQFRMVEMFDRMDCIGKAILGLTTQCAQCHTHKFDPLTHDEYFGMFAFLNNAYEAQSNVYTRDQLDVRADIASQIRKLEDEIRSKHPNWNDEIDTWENNQLVKLATWTPIEAIELGSVSGLNHPVQLADKSLLMLGHSSSEMFMIAEPDWKDYTGIQVEVLTHGDLPQKGPGRNVDGSWEINEVEVQVQVPGNPEWTGVELSNATADSPQVDGKSGDANEKLAAVSSLTDSAGESAWRAGRGRGRQNQPSVAVLQFDDKSFERPPAGSKLKVVLRMKEMVGCVRFSLTEDADPVALPIDHAAILAMKEPKTLRTEAEQAAIFNAWRLTLEDCADINKRIDAQWNRSPDPLTTVLHLSEREPENRRKTFNLERGEWDRPQHQVSPGTPQALHAFPSDAPLNRLEFAKWLASDRSPLTARVAVNRVWQAIFGEGLVETPEDFGTRASIPEYGELLDWLAVDFMSHGWSHKHLIKRIVTSDVYRQRSKLTPEEIERDANNRLLARGPRFRAEAEVIRDIALAASGLITHRLGGPPVIPPVPENVLNYNYVVPDYWKPTPGPDRYRRTVYGFRKRSMPDPVMSSFDGPNGDVACARRVRSNTPLAALTGLNEPIFVEAARAMALRVLREAGGPESSRSEVDRIRYAFRLCTSRLPTDAETGEIKRMLTAQRARIADGWLDARAITTGDSSQLPDLPPAATPQDAAAWTLVSRVLLNLDETLSKN